MDLLNQTTSEFEVLNSETPMVFIKWQCTPISRESTGPFFAGDNLEFAVEFFKHLIKSS